MCVPMLSSDSWIAYTGPVVRRQRCPASWKRVDITVSEQSSSKLGILQMIYGEQSRPILTVSYLGM